MPGNEGTMQMNGLKRGVVALGAALAVATGAGAAPTVAITSPVDGESVSRSATPTLAVTGVSLFDEPVPAKTTFFLRRSQCASGNDDARLSTQRGGSSEMSGCGYIAQSLNEAYILLGDEGLTNEYAAENGVPFTLDASRAITGTIRMPAGVGVVTTEVRLTGVTNDEIVTLGTHAQNYNGTFNYVNVTFSFKPDASYDKKDFTSLNLWLRTRGVNALSGSVDHRNGASSIVVPTYSTSFSPRVEFSLNNPSFTNVRAATLAPDQKSWSGTVGTPAVGTHKLYARAIQGASVTEAAPVTFTVTP